MTLYRVEVRVMPRPGLLDPQGSSVEHALRSLGFGNVSEVRVGKTIHVELEADDAEAAAESVKAMCRRVLANPVTEEFHIVESLELAG